MSRRTFRRPFLLGAALGLSALTVPVAVNLAGPEPAAAAEGNITVLAAASLTEAFTEIGKSFEGANPGAKVKFSFGSSSTLAGQANQGAPADVFASSDEENMAKVTNAGNADSAVIFARNRLAGLVGGGNPKSIGALSDFDRDGVVYVICALEVPCGKYGSQALKAAGVKKKPASYEENVKAVVNRVANGEADAGIVYVTDAKSAAGNTASFAIPDEHNVIARYPIAALKQAGNPDGATAFIDYVRSAAGQNILAKYGFLPPA